MSRTFFWSLVIFLSLVTAYYVKSRLGIDIFPHRHLLIFKVKESLSLWAVQALREIHSSYLSGDTLLSFLPF